MSCSTRKLFHTWWLVRGTYCTVLFCRQVVSSFLYAGSYAVLRVTRNDATKREKVRSDYSYGTYSIGNNEQNDNSSTMPLLHCILIQHDNPLPLDFTDATTVLSPLDHSQNFELLHSSHSLHSTAPKLPTIVNNTMKNTPMSVQIYRIGAIAQYMNSAARGKSLSK